VKILRNLLRDVPILYVMSVSGTISRTVEVPVTVRLVIVVVASVEVPRTVNAPRTLWLPEKRALSIIAFVRCASFA
jgi:hypothetical protein